jgi:hypothetical protein
MRRKVIQNYVINVSSGEGEGGWEGGMEGLAEVLKERV